MSAVTTPCPKHKLYATTRGGPPVLHPPIKPTLNSIYPAHMRCYTYPAHVQILCVGYLQVYMSIFGHFKLYQYVREIYIFNGWQHGTDIYIL